MCHGSCPGAGSAVRTSDRALRHCTLGYQHRSRWRWASVRTRHRHRGRGGLCRKLSGLPRRERRGRAERRSCRRHRLARTWQGPGEDGRQLLALRNDAVRLHSARDAVPETKSLTSNEIYAVSAYILSLNGIIGADDVLDAQSLPKVRMPNRDGFIPFPRNPK